MEAKEGFKGTWVQRFGIVVLGVIFGVLLFWLLGFLARDIETIRGPELSQVEARYVEAGLKQRRERLGTELAEVKEKIANKREQQQVLQDGTKGLQNTINQLLSIKEQSLKEGGALSGESNLTLVESQKLFLENQRNYQHLSEEVAELTGRQQGLAKEFSLVSAGIKQQRQDAREEYNRLMVRHRLKLAGLKLAVMVPVFLVAAWFFMRKRSGAYRAIVYAMFVAAFLRVLLIAHEYFPRKFFKYIALLVIIGIVVRLLVYLIGRVVSPSREVLVRQYQEAYDKGLCPVCGKPIIRSGLRYGAGNRRQGVVFFGAEVLEKVREQVYACPSCGTVLYGKCENCGGVRHSLLPFCEHCGSRG